MVLTWVLVTGTFGRFKKFDNGRWGFSSPGWGSDDAWGALPFSGQPGTLTVEQATMLAVAHGTANVDGTFVDASNSLGAGGGSYTLYQDTSTGHCVAVAV